MLWLSAVPALLCALVVILAPGYVLAFALGARGFPRLAFAPLLSVSLIAVAAVVAAPLSVPWSMIPVVALTVLAAGAAWFLRTGTESRNPVEKVAGRIKFPGNVAAYLGTAVAAALIGARMLYAIGSPSNFSQTFDNIFHLNAVAFIGQTHQASSFTVGEMTGISFYPAAWHAVVSLVVQLSGSSIPVAVNAANLVIAGLVWPLGAILFTRMVVGNSWLAMSIAGIMSAAFGSFPLMMADFGVLYPNLLSIALLPGMLAIGVAALGIAPLPNLQPGMVWAGLILVVPGIALAHPSTLMAFFAILVPGVAFVYARAWVAWRKEWPAAKRRALGWSAGLAAGMAVLVVAWVVIRPDEAAAFWPPIHSPAGSMWELLTHSLMNRPPAIIASCFVALGVVVAVRRRQWWLLGAFGVVCFLYLVVSSFRQGRIRDFLTGIWYNDSYRLAALVPTLAVVVATIGAVWGIRYLALRVRSRKWKASSSKSVVVAAVVGIAVLTQFGNVQYATQSANGNYVLTADSPLITANEMAVLNSLDALVPPDAVIASNPWNGSALAYALAGRTTMELHVLNSNTSPEDEIILSYLRDAKTNPAVCRAVHDLRVGYVLDFGGQEVNNGSHPAPGLDNLQESGTVELLLQHGEAKLFKITACS